MTMLACPDPECAVLNDPDQETCGECGKRLGLSDLMLRSLREAAASVPVPAASLSETRSLTEPEAILPVVGVAPSLAGHAEPSKPSGGHDPSGSVSGRGVGAGGSPSSGEATRPLTTFGGAA